MKSRRVPAESSTKKPKTSPSAASQEHPTPGSGLSPEQQAVLAMQQTIGNAAVQRWMEASDVTGLPLSQGVQRWTLEEAREQVPTAPSWAGDEANVRAIQRQLRRLGLYRLRLDSDYGRGTDAALVEAFGGDSFRTMAVEAVLGRLRDAEPSAGTHGQHPLRYGELFRDGVLDMTIGVGYDEALESNPTQSLDNFIAVLQARDFTLDRNGAAEVYRQAGRAMRPSVADQYFVKRDALVYTPPAGEARSIHAVIRLVSNVRGAHGAEAAQAFQEGMVQSDVSFYAGHGRYGTGPDFDRNFARFVLYDLDDPTVTEATILDYEVLEQHLRREVRRRRLRRRPWRQFLWRYEQGLMDVTFRNEGNIRINTGNLHRGEFGADLINWALEEGRVQAATGEGGTLASAAAAHPERRYRVIVFDGCRTRDYETSLRGTPGFGRETTHTITTTRSVLGDDDAATLAAFLDSVLGQQSAEQIVRDMDTSQGAMRSEGINPRGTFRSRGTTYDPRTPR